MKKGKTTISLDTVLDKVVEQSKIVRKYSIAIFIVFIGILYGFLLFQISSLSNAQPTSEAVSGQVKAAQIPHINQSVVNQLQTLQNNSVNVQALFNQARNNPFQ
jgi:hypothetical protein